MPLFRAVRAAITSLRARLRPSADECRISAAAAATAALAHQPCTQHVYFNQQMNDQLDDSARVLDDLDAKLLTLRTHVRNLRSQLATSHRPQHADLGAGHV